MKAVAPVGSLEHARRGLRLRQADLAEMVGVSRTFIGLAERGYIPSGPNRLAIAEALDVAQRELWPDEPEFNDERPAGVPGAVKSAGGGGGDASG